MFISLLYMYRRLAGATITIRSACAVMISKNKVKIKQDTTSTDEIFGRSIQPNTRPSR